MMNSQDSNMAMNSIDHASRMASESIQQAVCEWGSPSTLFKPKLSVDGDQWCALYGDDLQSGVAGFGDSPALAMADFNRLWYSPLAKEKAE
jgi:hypothetical protein